MLTGAAAAQVAAQQGKYLAKLVQAGVKPGMQLPSGVQPFKYGHKGSLAYVGNDNAVMVRAPWAAVTPAASRARTPRSHHLGRYLAFDRPGSLWKAMAC